MLVAPAILKRETGNDGGAVAGFNDTGGLTLY